MHILIEIKGSYPRIVFPATGAEITTFPCDEEEEYDFMVVYLNRRGRWEGDDPLFFGTKKECAQAIKSIGLGRVNYIDEFGTKRDKVASLAKQIRDEVYADTKVHASIVPAIEEWLADPDTERCNDETVTGLADAWIEAAHRES